MQATTTTKNKGKKTPAAQFSAPISEVHLVPLDMIDTPEQIRKEFDEESIEDLAKDIETRGLLQPVLLNPTGDRFQLIAGERRLRAIKFNGAAGIPALIVKASADDAILMQLAENIQREDLTLDEECQAVKTLYDMLGSLDKVAAAVKKSKPWCSKRYAMTRDDLQYHANLLLEDGITEDIDLLQALSKLSILVTWSIAQEWADKVRAGKAGREEIRAALKAAKEKQKATKEAAQQTGKVSHAKPKEPPPPPSWTIDNAIDNLSRTLTYANMPESALDLLESYTPEQQEQIHIRLIHAAEIGAGPEGLKTIGKLVMHGLYDTNYTDIDLMAMILGFKGAALDTKVLLAELQCPRKKA